MAALPHSDYWQCPNEHCKIHYYSLHPIFSLLEQHRSELAKGIREIGVLCIACRQMSARDIRTPDHIPDIGLPPGSFPAQKVFLIELKCDGNTCDSPVPILAATGPSMQKGDFVRLSSVWTFVGNVTCRNGHPPRLPQEILHESLLWSAN